MSYAFGAVLFLLGGIQLALRNHTFLALLAFTVTILALNAATQRVGRGWP